MINSNFGFTPLKEVWLGDCYPSSFYDHLSDEISDPLQQITEWTKQDLHKLQTFLESRGIKVRRPQFSNIERYVDKNGYLAKPPIAPRDNYLTLGSTLYSLHSSMIYAHTDPWLEIMQEYQSQGLDVVSPVDLAINCLSPPSLVRIGRDLYLDQSSHNHVWGFVSAWMVESAKEYRINICETDGHCDGVFCPVAPGVLVTSHYKSNYQVTFPDWEVFHIPKGLDNNGFPKSWTVNVASVDNNCTFNKYILDHAKDWVGDFRETVYEVNMLVLDEHNVISMKEYEPLDKWLQQRGITVHHFDFRTRSFWDSGWHCLTLDICRDDDKKDFFPFRGDNGVYWRKDQL